MRRLHFLPRLHDAEGAWGPYMLTRAGPNTFVQ